MATTGVETVEVQNSKNPGFVCASDVSNLANLAIDFGKGAKSEGLRDIY